MLTMGELRAHVLTASRAWLTAIAPLLQATGIHLVGVFSRLLPLLLGWVRSSDDALQAAALHALLGVTGATWPRIPAHAGAIGAVVSGCRDRVGVSENTRELAVAVLEALDACGGQQMHGQRE